MRKDEVCYIRADLCASGQQVRAVSVERVEMVNYESGYEQPAEPIWRVVVGGYCADFETESAARNFAGAIAALTPAPEAAQAEAVPVAAAYLIDLIGEFGREVFYLLDDCETSGPVGDEVHTITDEALKKVSEILDRIDALPFEVPGVILGPGAMLQEAIKRTFTPPAAPAPGIAEAALAEYRDKLCQGFCHQDDWTEAAHSNREMQKACDGCLAAATLRALKGGDA